MAFTKYMLKKGRDYAKLTKLGEDFPGAYSNTWHAWKMLWLKEGRALLRALAKELGMAEFKATYNKAGPAVTGEATLLGIWPLNYELRYDIQGLYINTADPTFRMYRGGDGFAQFMWRTITLKVENDPLTYSNTIHGLNRWLSYEMFSDMERMRDYFMREVEIPLHEDTWE